MQIPGNLQLTILGIVALVVSCVLYSFADRPPYTAPVDDEDQP